MRSSRQKSELSRALASCRGAFWTVGAFSGVVNLLMLTGSIYMLQVYDRVIPSRSVPTLVGLSVLVMFLFSMQGVLDFLRQRLLTRIASILDTNLTHRLYRAVVELPLRSRQTGDGLQHLRDFDGIRSFLSGMGPTALFDLPWLPLYLGLCFLLHPILGLTVFGGSAVLFALAVLTEVMSRKPAQEAAAYGSARYALAESSRHGAEAIKAMGMGQALSRRWAQANDRYLATQERASDVAGGFGSLSKVLRMLLQSVTLGIGAWLVIFDMASAGVIIASSILMTRALAPIELAIGHWRGFISSRQSWKRLGDLLAALPAEKECMSLPAPRQTLAVEGVTVEVPSCMGAVVHNVSFSLAAGQGLGIIGPSASGKSTLARALVGVWPALRGSIRLDGATLDQWNADALGTAVGYMPQEVELFDGTIAENIARFADEPDAKLVVAAAKAAGAHEMILRLPNGYETSIGEAGSRLSAGQRQRIALARALYGDPFLVVLDEPNSNLDGEGEAALTEAIRSVRERGGIVIVIAHRQSALAAIDQVLVLNSGAVQNMGPRDDVLRKSLVAQGQPARRPGAAAAQPIVAVATASPDRS
jgi:PrtD family type I secretion system ABC transporter